MSDKREMPDGVMPLVAFMRREKALSAAGLGVFLFLLGYFCGHLDERMHFALDLLALIAFGAATFFERQAAPRMVWILLLVASVVFAQMDFRLSGHLTQTRSQSAFESR
ncbi:hypothetical protein [Asaia bogorensis]|uniref:hypothetical protein n=1 Tax=Asaia bogorensis TaxID=91915 RepID=UPI0013CEFEDC|nr:hypothetical protein [Asaia bogorensis]